MDVSWAPFSSTVFAAVTGEGRVTVYDLHVNKFRPICVQGKTSSRWRQSFVFSNNSSEEFEIESSEARLKALFNFPEDYFLFESFNPLSPLLLIGDSRGHVHSLKLSPKLRKVETDVQLALISRDMKVRSGSRIVL